MSQTLLARNLGRLLKQGLGTILLALALIVMSFILNSVVAHAAQRSGSELRGTSLRSCTQQREECVELKAESLRGSQWKPLYAFKDGTVTLLRAGKETSYAAKDGFWDAQGDLLIFSTATADYSVDLKSLRVSEFLRKAGRK